MVGGKIQMTIVTKFTGKYISWQSFVFPLVILTLPWVCFSDERAKYSEAVKKKAGMLSRATLYRRGKHKKIFTTYTFYSFSLNVY